MEASHAAEIGVPGALVFIWFIIATIMLAFHRKWKIILPDDYILLRAVGIGIMFCWAQGLIGWGFRSSNVHTSSLALFAGALLLLYKIPKAKIESQSYGP